MPLETSFIHAEDRLDLTLHGCLDLTLAFEIADLLRALPAGLRTCILDLTRVDRVFESGLALLWMLDARLHRLDVTLVVLSDQPTLFQRLPAIMQHASLTIPQDSPAADPGDTPVSGGAARRAGHPRALVATPPPHPRRLSARRHRSSSPKRALASSVKP